MTIARLFLVGMFLLTLYAYHVSGNWLVLLLLVVWIFGWLILFGDD